MMTFPQEWDHLVAMYWNQAILNINLLIIVHLFGALLCGILVGYERSYHGRAAGIRTYSIVCMASTALTIASGYPGAWFGAELANHTLADPTRVIQGVQQGILAGIGFLGAGVIMKEGLNITGLTTAASIWGMCAIGILIGIGFYGAGIALSILMVLVMSFMSTLEKYMPMKSVIQMVIDFKHVNSFTMDHLNVDLNAFGYDMVSVGPMSFSEDKHIIHITVESHNKRQTISTQELAVHLLNREDIRGLDINVVRN